MDTTPGHELVTVPVCDWCGCYVETDNRRFAGFCSAACQQHARAVRDRAAASPAQRRGDRRQQAAAHQPAKRYLV